MKLDGAPMLVASLLLGAAGCDDPLPAVPPPHAKHDLVIEGGVVRYNGKALGPGLPMDAAIEALGQPSRSDYEAAIWDSLGLKLSREFLPEAQRDPEKLAPATCVSVQFDKRSRIGFPEDQEGNPLGFPSSATQLFPGRILFEGAPLFQGARVDQINRQVKVECHDPTTGSGFRAQGLGLRSPERTYRCAVQRPPRIYWLDTFPQDRKNYAVQLGVCCADKPCR